MPSRFGKAYIRKLYLLNGKKKDQLDLMTQITATADELNKMDGVTASTAEINAAADKSLASVVSATAATLSATQAAHAGKVVVLNRAAGITVTLPEATGTGDVYTFVVGTAATANAYIVKTADATNADFAGLATGVDQDDDSTDDFPAIQGDGYDVITLNRTTTGGVQPGYDKIVCTDIATDLWNVRVHYSVPTGSNPATPFSST